VPANTPLVRLLNASWFVWLLLALPGVVLTDRYARGVTFYGEYLHATGELGVRLLMLAMAVTPLKLMFPSAGWVRWLGQRRRYLGVAAFGYSLLHAVAYLERQATFTAIIDDAVELALMTGWIALLVMLWLAATSNDPAVRLLRVGWKWLHRTVYLAALLTFAHWILSAFDPTAAYVHLGILAALEAIRLVLRYRIRAYQPSSTPPSNQSQSK
jgi:methionine sulfoxide reductase heme-binding subunit